MLRALLFGDTHLGFDLPAHPRSERRRRGHDFQANFERVVAHALANRPGLVIHGGDVFDRPDPRDALVDDAFRPLFALAEAGIEVVVLAGNHERGTLPRPLFSAHPRIHVVDAPTCLRLTIDGLSVAVGAFPYVRKVRDVFQAQVAATGLLTTPADVRILGVHHCVEGATVGSPPGADFVFRHNDDVIQGAEIPSGIAALLSGHIHRHQVLTHDLRGRPLAAPMLYAGSVERTSFAEAAETKGFLELDFAPGEHGGHLAAHRFVPLPTRPMVQAVLKGAHPRAEAAAVIAAAPPDAVVLVRVPTHALSHFTAAWQEAAVPPTMGFEVRPLSR
jgi:exonuclease SbcD